MAAAKAMKIHLYAPSEPIEPTQAPVMPMPISAAGSRQHAAQTPNAAKMPPAAVHVSRPLLASDTLRALQAGTFGPAAHPQDPDNSSSARSTSRVPSGPVILSQIGPELGATTTSKVMNGQHLRSFSINLTIDVRASAWNESHSHSVGRSAPARD